MKLSSVMMGAALVAVAAWMSAGEDAEEPPRIVSADAPTSAPPAMAFGDAMPQFGASDIAESAPPPSVDSVRHSGTALTPIGELTMTENRLRTITQSEIAMMKAAGIGMDAQGIELPVASGVEVGGYAGDGLTEGWAGR